MHSKTDFKQAYDRIWFESVGEEGKGMLIKFTKMSIDVTKIESWEWKWVFADRQNEQATIRFWDRTPIDRVVGVKLKSIQKQQQVDKLSNKKLFDSVSYVKGHLLCVCVQNSSFLDTDSRPRKQMLPKIILILEYQTGSKRTNLSQKNL